MRGLNWVSFLNVRAKFFDLHFQKKIKKSEALKVTIYWQMLGSVQVYIESSVSDSYIIGTIMCY